MGTSEIQLRNSSAWNEWGIICPQAMHDTAAIMVVRLVGGNGNSVGLELGEAE